MTAARHAVAVDLPRTEAEATCYVLRPGDRVLVEFPDVEPDVNGRDAAQQWGRALDGRFPGVTFTVLCGGRVAAVQYAEDVEVRE